MQPTTAKSAQRAGKAALADVKHHAASPWVQRLERFGFLIRGVIYVVIGLLALQLALGAGGATTSPTSAIALIGRQPLGKVFLAVVAIGLAGYALWGFMRAILDSLGRGTDPKGLMDRAGFMFSGISYAGLLVPTIQTLLDAPGGTAQAGAGGGVPASLMTQPWSQWLVVVFGIFWVAAGAGQLLVAYTAHFMRDLKVNTMSAREVKTATWLGRLGYAARGIVFMLIGLIILQTVFVEVTFLRVIGANQAQGFDGALAALASAPYGTILLGAVALGLILFGVYSALASKWTQISTRRAG